MTARIVIGLFESSGIAKDARDRLRTEGVADNAIAVRVLKEIGPVPSTMEPELAAFDVDPMVVGNVRETYAQFIHNGETVVLVRAADEKEVGFAIQTLRQFAPVAVDVLNPAPQA
jgi:hypothetical protein